MSGVSVTRTVPLAPLEAWARVSDVIATAELSEEVQRVEWVQRADSGAPVVGDRFLAHNQMGDRAWSVESVVTAAEPGRSFGFAVGGTADPTALWAFDLEPDGSGTRVTYRVEIGPGPNLMKAASGGDAERLAQMTDWRLRSFEEGMTRLLESLR